MKVNTWESRLLNFYFKVKSFFKKKIPNFFFHCYSWLVFLSLQAQMPNWSLFQAFLRLFCKNSGFTINGLHIKDYGKFTITITVRIYIIYVICTSLKILYSYWENCLSKFSLICYCFPKSRELGNKKEKPCQIKENTLFVLSFICIRY